MQPLWWYVSITRSKRIVGAAGVLIDPVFRLHFLYKAMLKARTNSLHNPVTQVWLELFRAHLNDGSGL